MAMAPAAGPHALGFHCRRNKIVLMTRALMRTVLPTIAPTSAGFENPLVKPNADVDVAVELYLAVVLDLSWLDVQGHSES